MAKTAVERSAERALLAALVLVLLLGGLAKPRLVSLGNILDLLASTSVSGLLALGLLVVLLAGGLDISFTAVASIAQYSLGVVLAGHDIGWVGSLLLVSAIGLALGLLNGGLVSLLRTQPIVVTIALLNIYYGGLILASGGVMLYSFPDFFSNTIAARIGHHPVQSAIVIFLAAIVVTWVLLARTHWGRIIRSVGGNAVAAERQGISILSTNLFAYGYLGVLSGLAGFVQAQLLQAITPGALVGTELEVVAATVLGGASLLGGRGTVAGTVLGVLLIAVIGNVLVLLGISPYWHQAITGLVVLGSIAIRMRKRVSWFSAAGSA